MFYLKQIDLIGFKSFANKTALQFTPGTTSIVGPNGSGKSNIVDAISWVLGEQRIKQLRGKKSEDIIFAGSESKPRMGYCEVSLTFHNDGTIPELLSEITVTRKITRNQESEYEINKKKTTLQDILLLLSRAHVGAKQVQIIGQGMIDQMLLATPQKRKELFDEGAGLQEFYVRRQKSYANLKKTLHVLEEVKKQRDILAPELSHAKQLVHKLQKRQAVEEKLKALQQSFYHFAKKDLQHQEETLSKQYNTLQESYTLLKNSIDTLKIQTQQMAKPEKRNDQDIQQQYQALTKQKQILQKQISGITNQIQTPSAKKHLSTNDILQNLKSLRKAQHTFLTQTKTSSLGTKELFDQLHVWMKHLDHLIVELENKPLPTPSVFMEKLADLQKQSSALDEQIANVTQTLIQQQKKQQESFTHYTKQQDLLQTKQQEYLALSTKIHQMDTSMALLGDQRKRLEQEIKEGNVKTDQPSPTYPHKPNESQIHQTKNELLSLGLIDPSVLKTYASLQKEMDDLTKQTEDLQKAMQSLTDILFDLDSDMKKLFYTHFSVINTAFQGYFSRLFGGGKAELMILKTQEEPTPEEELPPLLQKWKYSSLEKEIAGIDIAACPPKKKVHHLSLLSGGERSLTALALICAFLEAHPVPFVILDEVDAALDESNSAKLADIFKELSQKTQLILITHNRATMSGADVLYGITMQQPGVSRLVSLKLDQALAQVNKYRG